MDPNNISVTPGSNSNDNGGSLVHISSCRHLMSFLPTGTQLATTDGRDSGSSSLSPSTASPDLESHSLHPEETPLNQVRRLLLVSPARSPASTDDDVLIMDGVLVDSGPGSTTATGTSSPSLTTMGPATCAGSSGGSGSRRSGSRGHVIVCFALMISSH